MNICISCARVRILDNNQIWSHYMTLENLARIHWPNYDLIGMVTIADCPECVKRKKWRTAAMRVKHADADDARKLVASRKGRHGARNRERSLP